MIGILDTCLLPCQSIACTLKPTAWHAWDSPAEPQKYSRAIPAFSRRSVSEYGLFALVSPPGLDCAFFSGARSVPLVCSPGSSIVTFDLRTFHWPGGHSSRAFAGLFIEVRLPEGIGGSGCHVSCVFTELVVGALFSHGCQHGCEFTEPGATLLFLNSGFGGKFCVQGRLRVVCDHHH